MRRAMTMWMMGAAAAVMLLACEKEDATKDEAPPTEPAAADEAKPDDEQDPTDEQADKGDAPAEEQAPEELTEEAAVAMLGQLGAVEDPKGQKIPADAEPQTTYEKLAHEPVQGKIGSHDGAVLLLGDDGTGGSGGVAPFVAMKEGDQITGYALAPMPYALTDLEAVMLEDLGQDGDVDVLVHGKFMTGMGPQGTEEFPATVVYVFDEGAFTASDELAKEIGEADSADKVRAALVEAGELSAAE